MELREQQPVLRQHRGKEGRHWQHHAGAEEAEEDAHIQGGSLARQRAGRAEDGGLVLVGDAGHHALQDVHLGVVTARVEEGHLRAPLRPLALAGGHPGIVLALVLVVPDLELVLDPVVVASLT